MKLDPPEAQAQSQCDIPKFSKSIRRATYLLKDSRYKRYKPIIAFFFWEVGIMPSNSS